MNPPNPELVALPWDSHFFDRSVYKLVINSDQFNWALLKDLKAESLVYVFSNGPVAELAEPVDIKVTLECEMRSRKLSADFASTCEIYDAQEQLRSTFHELAVTSSRMSRFRLDSKLGPAKADEMYKIWIDKAINDPVGHRVIFVRDGLDVAGMISVKILPSHFSIELVAVADKFQGKGYGKELMSRCMRLAEEMNIKTVSVATQSQNDAACRLYQKFGFVIKDITYVYHLHS